MLNLQKVIKRCNLITILFFLLVAILLTYPLIFHLDSIFGMNIEQKYFDTPLFIYFVHYFKESILNLKFPIPITKYYYPEGVDPIHDDLFPAYSFSSALLSLITGFNEIVVNNIFSLFTLFLSGLAMYFLVYEFTKNKVSSLFGGLVYMSSHYTIHELAIGHVGLMQLFWIPLIFLYLERLIRKPNFKDGIFLGIFLGLQFLSCLQYTVYLTVILPLYLIFRDVKILKNMKFIKACLLSLIVFLILTGWYMIFFIGKEYVHRTLEENIEDMVFVFYEILWIGDPIVELPIISLFSLIGVFLILKQKLKYLYQFIAIGIFAILCIFGPFSNFAPYAFLLKYWPFYSALRIPYRMVLFALISVCITGATFLSMLKKQKYLGYLFILILLIYFIIARKSAYFDTFKTLSEEETILYKSISKIPGNFSIAEYPNNYNCWYVFNILYHGKNLVGGCAANIPKTHENFLNKCGDLILDISKEDCKSLVKNFNIRYVTYHSEKYDDWNNIYNQLNKTSFLTFVEKDNNVYLFQINF